MIHERHGKEIDIRNSTAEFLTFLAENREDGVQVVYIDETIWATQAAMGELQELILGTRQTKTDWDTFWDTFEGKLWGCNLLNI